MNIQPSCKGYIKDEKDALLIFQAVLDGKINHIPRRPYEIERPYLIISGNIFVSIEEISGIKRWTDGIAWSPSRIQGKFLIYKELNKNNKNSTSQINNDNTSVTNTIFNNQISSNNNNNDSFSPKNNSTDLSNSIESKKVIKLPPFQHLSNSKSNQHSSIAELQQENNINRNIIQNSTSSSNSSTSNSSNSSDFKKIFSSSQINSATTSSSSSATSSSIKPLINPLPSSINSSDDKKKSNTGTKLKTRYTGFMKKTISISVPVAKFDNAIETLHIVSYYHLDDVKNNKLLMPKENTLFKDVIPSEELVEALKKTMMGNYKSSKISSIKNRVKANKKRTMPKLSSSNAVNLNLNSALPNNIGVASSANLDLNVNPSQKFDDISGSSSVVNGNNNNIPYYPNSSLLYYMNSFFPHPAPGLPTQQPTSTPQQQQQQIQQQQSMINPMVPAPPQNNMYYFNSGFSNQVPLNSPYYNAGNSGYYYNHSNPLPAFSSSTSTSSTNLTNSINTNNSNQYVPVTYGYYPPVFNIPYNLQNSNGTNLKYVVPSQNNAAFNNSSNTIPQGQGFVVNNNSIGSYPANNSFSSGKPVFISGINPPTLPTSPTGGSSVSVSLQSDVNNITQRVGISDNIQGNNNNIAQNTIANSNLKNINAPNVTVDTIGTTGKNQNNNANSKNPQNNSNPNSSMGQSLNATTNNGTLFSLSSSSDSSTSSSSSENAKQLQEFLHQNNPQDQANNNFPFYYPNTNRNILQTNDTTNNTQNNTSSSLDSSSTSSSSSAKMPNNESVSQKFVSTMKTEEESVNNAKNDIDKTDDSFNANGSSIMYRNQQNQCPNDTKYGSSSVPHYAVNYSNNNFTFSNNDKAGPELLRESSNANRESNGLRSSNSAGNGTPLAMSTGNIYDKQHTSNDHDEPRKSLLSNNANNTKT